MSDINRPLWQVMHETICSLYGKKDPHQIERQIYAALLRAIAMRVEHDFDSNAEDPVADIVAWLHHEADKAETGE